MRLSIIICTHNPRADYLCRVLDLLARQTLSKDQWELLLIDNASQEPLAGKWDLSWHPNAKHIAEQTLGLTPARLRGIREAGGDLLVFVDDDNLLAENYLQTALDLANERPWLGAFGGSSLGEFEVPVPLDLVFMLPQLAVREITREAWVCLPGTQALAWAPCGAGMVVRRAVAEMYAKNTRTNPLRLLLDRRGTSLASAGDSDLALSACELGLAVGVFPQLILHHLIPAARLDRRYLLRLAEAMRRSHIHLSYVRDASPMTPPGSAIRRSVVFRAVRPILRLLRRWFAPNFADQFRRAEAAGARTAFAELASLPKPSGHVPPL